MPQIDRIAEPWGTRTPYGPGETWPVRVDSFLEPGLAEHDVDRWVPSATILHSNGDALDIAVKDGRIAGVRGRAGDRVNRGRLGPKDLYGWQAGQSPDRLRRPLVREHGRLVETDWDTAMDRVAGRARELLAEQGPSAIGFYTTGQLFLEEYYTLALIAHGGIGTNHVDGNTRLCTATAAAALKESFGCDGQPGSYTDVDHADVIALYGHNMAETQSVLWSRVLDRLAGPNPPRLVCVDPRETAVARAAAVHLANRPGTNVPLMNGLLHEIIANGWIDERYIREHPVGFEELRERVRDFPAEEAARLCDVPVDDLREAARLIGTADRLLSTVLQGFYQSHQATAAAVQVNNIHLVRGMLGRPGCGVLQMNGQPTAQNTRECGADGDLPGFRNWSNDDHVRDLARVWNVDPMVIPHYAPPTHVMQMLRYAEEGSLRFLYVTGTNPAVSLPELARVRSILEQERLFLVVQDIFPSETALMADVVLPAATWGEKTGTLTNADRTVHLSDKAVDPPGEARPDLDILLDLARRLELTDKDGAPLVRWHDAEGAFEAWKECSRGRPCDYSGLTYELLRGGGVQWPCDARNPGGTERLYADGRFRSAPGDCEDFGHDLVTGAPLSDTEYRALNPGSRAIIKAAEYLPAHEEPGGEHPFWLITGRTVYHFHTRTKTARVPQLQRAAPEPWAELSPADARRLGLAEGDLVEVATSRGAVRARLRVTGMRDGVVFLPFHYGYWDRPGGHRPEDERSGRAANELTATDWDPVSKQPLLKTAAARVTLVEPGAGGPSAAPTTAAARPAGAGVPATTGGPQALAGESGQEPGAGRVSGRVREGGAA
ncbi:molybdopterin oxidoreductase family protein [Nonomuraea terrae]|uniref:molybdopterin oxidoreductase family protein n=1 Tax=Nonomuraea terrae TaxID=2530383 RepID=UPI0037924F58